MEAVAAAATVIYRPPGRNKCRATFSDLISLRKNFELSGAGAGVATLFLPPAKFRGDANEIIHRKKHSGDLRGPFYCLVLASEIKRAPSINLHVFEFWTCILG